MKKLFFMMTCLLASLAVSAADYAKVTTTPTDWSGTYILVYETSATAAHVWTGLDKKGFDATGDGDKTGTVAATIANGRISGTFTELEIMATDGGYSIKLLGGDNVGKFITSKNTGKELTFSTSADIHTIALTSNGVEIKTSQKTYTDKGTEKTTFGIMRFNKSADTKRFRYYTSGQEDVQLYKKAAPAQTRTITWSISGTEIEESFQDYQQPVPTLGDPTSSDCDGSKVFVGWTTAAIVGTTDIAPAELYATAELPIVSADETYYAVFATATTKQGIVTEKFNSGITNNAWKKSLEGSYDTGIKFKFGKTDNYIQSPVFSGAISEVSFQYKGNSASNAYLAFLVSTDGSSFTEITAERLTNPGSTSGTKNITLDATASYKAFKLNYTKTTGNLALDNIIVKYEGEVTTYSEYATDCSAADCTDAEAIVEDGEATLNTDFDLTGLFLSYNGNTPVFTCTSANSASCTITSSEFTATAAGDYTIQVVQEADETYCAVNETFTVTVPQIVLATPANLANETPAATTVTLSWDAVENASEYEISIIPFVDSWRIKYNGTSCDITGLEPEKDYIWTVKAIGEGNYANSAESTTGEFSTRALLDFTITWSNNGESYTEGTPSTIAKELSRVTTLPTAPTAPSAAPAKKFVGWTATPIVTEQLLMPEDLFTDAAGSPTIIENTTFYAVFADVTTAGEGKITEMAEGTYYLSHTKESITYYLKGNGTGSAPSAVEDKAEATIFDAVADGENYIFYVSGTRNKWLYCTSSNNGVRVGTNDNKTWTVGEGTKDSGTFDLKHVETSRYLCLYNTQDFRCYTSANGDNRTENTDLEYAPLTSNYITSIKTGPSTALENVNSEVKVVKVIENGQLVIIREGVRYNVLGARLN